MACFGEVLKIKSPDNLGAWFSGVISRRQDRRKALLPSHSTQLLIGAVSEPDEV